MPSFCLKLYLPKVSSVVFSVVVSSRPHSAHTSGKYDLCQNAAMPNPLRLTESRGVLCVHKSASKRRQSCTVALFYLGPIFRPPSPRLERRWPSRGWYARHDRLIGVCGVRSSSAPAPRVCYPGHLTVLPGRRMRRDLSIGQRHKLTSGPWSARESREHRESTHTHAMLPVMLPVHCRCVAAARGGAASEHAGIHTAFRSKNDVGKCLDNPRRLYTEQCGHQ